MAEISPADIMALTKDNDGWAGGGVGWIILLFIFLLAISGNGFFGNGANNATQASLTTAELYSALGNQDLKNDVRSGFATMADRTYLLDKDVLENRFTTQLGFQNLGSQMQNCCLKVKKFFHKLYKFIKNKVAGNHKSNLVLG